MRWDGTAWTGETRPMAPPVAAAGSIPESAGQEPAVTQGGAATKRSRRPLFIAAAALAVLLLAGGITAGVVAETNQDHLVAVAHAKAVAAKKQADALAAKNAAKNAADTAERASRKAAVTRIEASVKKLAEDDVAKGALDGPVLNASCDPVSGSTDVLTDLTTTFNCFVATHDNGDGTSTGYYFNSTINWGTGSYTYGLGKAT
jgi:hypothetical protein